MDDVPMQHWISFHDEIIGGIRDRLADPVDERERRSAEIALDVIAALVRPWDEHADPTHVTASAILVGVRGVVLHRHKRLGLWLQPGGHVDDGEHPAQAARREAIEETGITSRHLGSTPALIHIDVHPGPRGHTHLDLRYLLWGDDVDPAPATGESPDVAWFAWEEALDLADDGLRGGLLRARRYLEHGAETGVG